jgi:hypothetical protein
MGCLTDGKQWGGYVSPKKNTQAESLCHGGSSDAGCILADDNRTYSELINRSLSESWLFQLVNLAVTSQHLSIPIVASRTPVPPVRVAINFEPLLKGGAVHCDHEIPETICAGLLHGEAPADSINQQLIPVRRLSEKPRRAILDWTAIVLYLHHTTASKGFLSS